MTCTKEGVGLRSSAAVSHLLLLKCYSNRGKCVQRLSVQHARLAVLSGCLRITQWWCVHFTRLVHLVILLGQ